MPSPAARRAKRLARFGFSSYREYLASDHWKRTKKSLGYPNRKCYICKTTPVDAHHKSYNRICEERPSDLLPLCRRCHHSVHQYYWQHGGSTNLNTWNMTRKLKRSSYAREVICGSVDPESARALSLWRRMMPPERREAAFVPIPK